MKKLAGLILFLFAASSVLAQRHEKPLVQFSGVIHNADSSGVIIPYVTIMNLSDHNNVSQSNYKGYYSFVVHERDTLRFSCVGYNDITVIIPASVPARSYTIQASLKPQIVNLPAFRVFPWATTEEFTRDFLSMKIADDDLAIARKNLSNASITLLEKTLPRDGLETGNVQDFHNNIVNSHYVTNPLFNPFAWGSLINSISAGDKSRSEGSASPSPVVTTTGN
jgi:hypothetical protein